MEMYVFKEKIGEGSFGTVVRAIKDGISYAIKEITGVNVFRKEEVESEINIMTKLNHPNLIRIHEWSYDEATELIAIVMEYCPNGDFRNYALTKKKIFSNKETLDLAKQVLNAFIVLNSKSIIHRDLKPENLLVGNNGQIKVADFGCARCLRSEEISKIQSMSFDKGTPCFAAPQLLMSQPYSGKCDVWSLGCIVYFMAAGKHPFLEKNVQDIIRLILDRTENKNIQITGDQPISDEVKYLIRRCLQYKDSERASWRELSLSRIFSEKVGSAKDYLQYLKSLSNIANWISKTFWKERKKYKILENKDEIFIYFIIKFQYSILKLGEKILERNLEYKYLLEDYAWKKYDVDQASIDHYKTVYLKQTEDYFNLLKNGIKSPNALKVIHEKETHRFLVFSDLQHSIRTAFRLLLQISSFIKSEDDKVMAVIARWINFERYFQFENRPSLEKILVEKIDNVAEVVREELARSTVSRA